MDNKLLPCPFCGNKDVTLWPMGHYESPCCEHCGATIEQNIAGDATEKQVKAWNTRVDVKCND